MTSETLGPHLKDSEDLGTRSQKTHKTLESDIQTLKTLRSDLKDLEALGIRFQTIPKALGPDLKYFKRFWPRSQETLWTLGPWD